MPGRLQDVILRGTRAAQPDASDISPGALYYVTDENKTERVSDDGLSWESFSDASSSAASHVGVIGLVIDGGASVITTGFKTAIQIPYNCTITGWTILSNDAAITSGSIVIDIWKDTYANYPPTVADTITASAKPTLSSATKATSTTLTGWTTVITAGDIIGFNVDSVSLVKKITLTLTVTI